MSKTVKRNLIAFAIGTCYTFLLSMTDLALWLCIGVGALTAGITEAYLNEFIYNKK